MREADAGKGLFSAYALVQRMIVYMKFPELYIASFILFKTYIHL
jgi:hypothetical protein